MGFDTVDFGKYKGMPWTRVPISYLKWLVNEKTQYAEKAMDEIKRRGTEAKSDIEISNHAIDRVSLRCLDTWRGDAKNGEGLYTWLNRVVSEAIQDDGKKSSRIVYKGMVLIIAYGDLYPTLLTIYNSGESLLGK